MDKKALFAFVLCAIITLWMLHTMQPSEKTPEEVKEEEVVKEIPEVVERKLLEREIKAVEEQQVKNVITQKDIDLKDNIVIQNDLIRTVWTNDGASLKSAVLTEFLTPDKARVLELLRPAQSGVFPLSMELSDEGYQLKNRRFEVLENRDGRVVFTTLLENGLRVTKEISLDMDKYHLDIDIVLQNTTDSEMYTGYSTSIVSGIYPEFDYSLGLASVAGIDVGRGKTKLVRAEVKDLPYKNESVGITWAGAVSKYFAVILRSENNDRITATISETTENSDPFYEDDFVVTLQTKKISLPPQGTHRDSYQYFLGPKKDDILRQFNEDIIVLLEYGWTTSLCKILIKTLNMFYGIIPNYGVAILLLTILVKLVLFPLTRKSQMSMFRMQQLQPLISQLKEKHKGDKQRMGQEQMKLFKEHGVNPMSGCLPILLQLPVFFALFRTLQLSFEMRQAPFVSWIADLSKPDTLLQLPFTLPVLGDGLNILPIVMGIASFVQMKLTPKTISGDDPQAKMQQKMMQIMPLIFPFILYTMPSGLTLYWTTSTLISIGEQMFIRRSIKKIDIYYKGKRVTKGKTKPKTKTK